MIDLPIAPTEPKIIRAAASRQGANPPQYAAGAQADESSFPAVLALERKLAITGLLPQGPAAPAAAAKAGSDVAPADDAAQTAATSDAPVSPAGAVAIAFSPALAGAARVASGLYAGDEAAPNAAEDDAPDAPALAAAMAYPPALPSAPIASPATTVVSPLPAVSSPASTTHARVAFGPRQNPLLGESAARDAEVQSPAVSRAATFAASGALALSAEGEIHRDPAFVANLLDQHKTAAAPAASPAAAAAILNQSGSAASVQVAPATIATLDARVAERGWDQGLGDKLVWMAGQKRQVAQLQLNPPELGPLKITLTLNDDQASAQFVSAHAAVREAIESAMPRLRDMLADSGITLGNANVSADTFREQAQPQQQARAYPAPGAAAAADPDAPARGELLLRRSHGLVDTFA